MANLGRSITVRGDVSGDEDLVIEGLVEGRIDLQNHRLTIGPGAQVKAEIRAKAVTIVGEVRGNVTATERADLHESAVLEGDLASPRVSIQEGARLNGNVTMQVGAPVEEAASRPRPAAFPAHGPTAPPRPRPGEASA